VVAPLRPVLKVRFYPFLNIDIKTIEDQVIKMIKNDPKLSDLHDLSNKDILKRIKTDDALVEIRQELEEKITE
jgi:hypothetical protein